MTINTFFLSTLILNIFLFLNINKISKFYNVFDYPDNKRKLHKKPTAVLGGLFLVINFLIIIIYYLFFFSNKIFPIEVFGYLDEIRDARSNKAFLSFFVIPLLFFFIGYLDDKFNLKPNTKFINLTLLILLTLLIDQELIVQELRFEFIEKTIKLNKFSIFFTTLSIIILVNALNMFDGINLQSLITYLIFFLILVVYKSFILISIFFIIQLLFIALKNFNGKIFLGNSGNLFLSYLVSLMIIKSYNLKNFENAEMVLLILIIPGLDLIRLFFKRILSNKHPFSSDRNHLQHILIKKFSIVKSNLIIFLMIVVPNLTYYYVDNFILCMILSLGSYMFTIFFSKKTN
jgi:UDP-GlcNAc:undecaprenyl-phosphate GlcNAc-1-phosphate transferase